jgi:hypothetical protein
VRRAPLIPGHPEIYAGVGVTRHPGRVNRLGPNDLDGLLVIEGVTSDFSRLVWPDWVDPHGPV